MTTRQDRERIIKEGIEILRAKGWTDMKIHVAMRVTYDKLDKIQKKRK